MPTLTQPTHSSLTTCIVVGHPPGYSETFIRALIERLPGQRVVVTTSWRYTYNRAHTLLPLPLRVSFKAFRYLSGWAGPIGRMSTGIAQMHNVYAYQNVFRRNHVNVVLAQYGPNGVAVLDACIASQIPLVVHFHGFDAHLSETLEEYGASYRHMFAYATSIIAVSQAMKQQLIQLGAPPQQITHIACGVDVQMFAAADPAHAPPHFLAVGRFVEKKAPYLTLLAFEQVLRECPEARLTMVGDGILWETCRQLVQSYGIGHAVSLVGARPHAEVAALMQQSRAFVQHSLCPSSGDSEGTPVAILEAGAAGLPVVATRHAGIKDVVIEAETGFLVEEGDIATMAHYMLRLARDPELAAQLGRKARAHIAANYSMEHYLARVTAILQQAAATAPAKRKGA